MRGKVEPAQSGKVEVLEAQVRVMQDKLAQVSRSRSHVVYGKGEREMGEKIACLSVRTNLSEVVFNKERRLALLQNLYIF